MSFSYRFSICKRNKFFIFPNFYTRNVSCYNLVKYTATGIAALVLLLAGVSYMMSGSDPKKRDNAKGMAMYVIIGLVIIWAAPLVVQFIVG